MSSDSAGTLAGFNETIHAPVRLRICGILRNVDEIDFAALRDILGIGDASLSKHLRILHDAGYLSLKKRRSQARSDGRRLTWIKQTPQGRRAFDGHLVELQRIAAGSIERADTPQEPPEPATA